MFRYVVLIVALAGCKKESEIARLEATATVVGPMVVVTAACTKFERMSAAELGAFTKCKDGTARLEIPIDKVGMGKQTFRVRGSNENGMTIADVDLTVDVSLAGQPPYLHAGCADSDPATSNPASIEVKIGEHTAPCKTFSGANAKLLFDANPNAKLTIAGKTVSIPATGKLPHLVDFPDQVLALQLADVALDPEDQVKPRPKATLVVPYTVESDGKTLSGNIEITETSAGALATHFLAQVAAGKSDRTGFAAPTAGERRTVGWIAYDSKLRVTDRSGAIRDLDMIAVEHETTRTENGTCDYKDTDDKAVTAKRVLIDSEFAIMNLADGTITKQPFPASTDPRNCPMFSMMDSKDPKVEARINEYAITTFLRGLAEPR